MGVRTDTERRVISVQGIVQGVGFRPFVYGLAMRYGLTGMVHNDTAGVHVEVEGPSDLVALFVRQIRAEAPPLAVVESVEWSSSPLNYDSKFRIQESRSAVHGRALVSPDIGTCNDCVTELNEPGTRRHRYPFTNCTNCGPRFTITRGVPYDRARTTMVGFAMCVACQSEYDDPGDRRFHAQPNACPQCGPHVRLHDRSGHEVQATSGDVVSMAAMLLRNGAILSVKGVGGYHLACNALDHDAVHALRQRKVRADKPFALMARDLKQLEQLCVVSAAEELVVTGPARPVVLLERRPDGLGALVAPEVAPRQSSLGVMLPYSPLHHLLLGDAGTPLVMTSGNRSDEPIAYRDQDVQAQLGDIADFFLEHNRPIHARCDDTVLRVFDLGAMSGLEGRVYPIRRSRGFAPAPLSMRHPFTQDVLACGAELKNTFCLGRERHAFISHHIGDLRNYETLVSYVGGINHYRDILGVTPQLVACDLHPEYLSTKYARDLEELGYSVVEVQHHHAHVASCLADNDRPISERVIGVVFDGTGYGTDGTIWGGEFFEGSLQDGFLRRGHLATMALPGGDAAVQEPWRVAAACLVDIYGPDAGLDLDIPALREVDARTLRAIPSLLSAGLAMPGLVLRTSSAGRLFDAVAALVGVPGSLRTTYEGQAAVELELAASPSDVLPYVVALQDEGDHCIVDTRGLIIGVVEDVLAGVSSANIAARFHRSMTHIVVSMCLRLRSETGVQAVALSGGTFQNVLLLKQVVDELARCHFTVYVHGRVPTNDGGLSLGQAVLADCMMRKPIQEE